MGIFRLYPKLKLLFEHNKASQNLFLSACRCWDARLSLRDIDQKFTFGGTIGYGDSYLGFMIFHFKVIRLHAIIHNAARAVRPHSGSGSGYCLLS